MGEHQHHAQRLPILSCQERSNRQQETGSRVQAGLSDYRQSTNLFGQTGYFDSQRVLVTEVEVMGRAKRFVLEPDREAGTEALAAFRAGQYISVFLNVAGCTLTRAYSLSSTPRQAIENRYAITVERNEKGFASDHILDTWQVGTRVEISMPLGEFCHEPSRDAAHVVAIAGGSGITPFLSMAGAIADGTEDFRLTILYGNRTADEILYRDTLGTLADQCHKLRVVHVLSDEVCHWAEHGVVTAELVGKYAPEGEWSVFVCGSPAMYAFLREDLKKLELPRRRLRFEMPGEIRNAESLAGFPAYAKGRTFRLIVERLDAKLEIPAKSGESILAALERAGIRHPSRCRCGECGFCRSILVSGTYFIPRELEHRRAADIKNGYIHPCCTYPTGDCHIRLPVDIGSKTAEDGVHGA